MLKQPSDFEYSDIGVLLAKSILNLDISHKFKKSQMEETIRATVVGAGTYTTDVSGSTVTFTGDVFPTKNMPVLYLHQTDAKNIKERIDWMREQADVANMALYLEGQENPDFTYIQELSRAIIEGASDIIEKQGGLFVIVKHDMAKVLGQTLYRDLSYKTNVVCIDSIRVSDGDYIDMGNRYLTIRSFP